MRDKEHKKYIDDMSHFDNKHLVTNKDGISGKYKNIRWRVSDCELICNKGQEKDLVAYQICKAYKMTRQDEWYLKYESSE